MDTSKEPDRLTIQEAAQRLGVSDKTVRRWIKNGRLPADLERGPYGEQYWVPIRAVQAAQASTEIVRVDRPADPALLMQAFSDALESTLDRKLDGLSTQLDQRVQAQQEAVTAAIRDIVRETIRDELDTLSERQSARDVQLVEQVRGVLEERKADARLSRWQRLWTWVRQGGQST